MFENDALKLLQDTGIEIKVSDLEVPHQEEFGDLSFPCFNLAKKQKRNPVEIANELSSKIKLSKNSPIEKIEVKGPYVNFFYNYSKLSQKLLKEILLKGEKYGRSSSKEKIMIEYSSPNTNKPLHVGHLRNDSLGMSVSNILEFLGNKVIRTAIINDRGVHICKSMIAYQKWGGSKTPKNANIKPDHFVGDFYVMFEKKLKEDPALEDEIHVMLKKWEDNDKKIRVLWKKMNDWVLTGMKETYKTFGSEFDFWTYESEIYDKAKPIIDEGIKEGLFFNNERGDLAAKLEPDLPDKVVLRADGTSVYITQDMALAKFRFQKYKIDKMIYVVASEQNLHFNQLFKILELLGYDWYKKCHHLSYGLVNLRKGRRKTREGTVVDDDELIKEEANLAKGEIMKREKKINQKELDERALKIGLAAIKYYLLKIEPTKDVLFDPNKAISFEGDTGPYIQYAYTRCVNILKKAKTYQKNVSNLQLVTEEKNLVKTLSKFTNVVKQASIELKPNHICNYAYELATKFSNFYEKCPVIKADNKKLRNFRLSLTTATKIILGNCLGLMGIETLDKM